MEMRPDCVYLYRLNVDATVLPAGQYTEAARQSLGRLEFPVPRDGSVVVKPNITIPATPDTRIITHPGFVVGLLQQFMAWGVPRDRLAVVEAWRPHRPDAAQPVPQFDPARRPRGQVGLPEHGNWRPPGPLPEVSGYDAALAALGLALTNHDLSAGVVVPVPGGVVFPELHFTHWAAQAGLLVNVPVAKCHNLSCTTLCTKNLQGLVMSPQRHMCTYQAEDQHLAETALSRLTDSGLSLHEERFCHKHADLLSAVRQTGVPRLCVVDGLVGRDGTAFNQGGNHALGWVLIGDNEVHVDAVATYLFGLDPEATPYLRVAAARGLGTHRVADIEVIELTTGQALGSRGLAPYRHDPALMPVARCADGYYPRFRSDGTVVPWALDRVNDQRRADGLAPVSAD
jgi:uncharacterized protein (DUF362 family)